MAFGPTTPASSPIELRTATTETLLPTVRAAAEKLVAQLNEFQRYTQDWQDAPLADAVVDVALAECLWRLARTDCWGEVNRLPSSELWRIASPLLEVGSLQAHARFKPYGYAGDHEMLARICEQSCCDHPLGAAMDRYFLRQAAPAAVRSRTEQIAASMVAHCLRNHRGDYHLVSVGSGPAIDIQRALHRLPDSLRRGLAVSLLDLAPEALEHARRRIEPLIDEDALRIERTNLNRLPGQKRMREWMGSTDLLICSGLFDYLDDEPAAKMLRFFYDRLRPGGQMLVGNFAASNPTRAFMEWIGNWYLHYRTPEDLDRLAVAAGIPQSRWRIGTERLGVVLFLVAEKS